MRNKLNVLLVFIVFVIVVSGCKPEEPRFHNGVQLREIHGERLVEDVAKSQTKDYENKLLLVKTLEVDTYLSDGIRFKEDMSSYNFGKSWSSKLPDTLYITCKTDNLEKFKQANVQKYDSISIVGRLKKNTFKDAVIEHCEFYEITYKSKRNE